jgi:hypothetical protein
MAMSAPLAVLMAKVLVMISVIAAIMAFATIFGLSIPKRLDKMDMAGGRQQRFRCDSLASQLSPVVP